MVPFNTTEWWGCQALPTGPRPGLGLVHPASTFSEIPAAGKWILSFCMLIGRLEIYTVMVLLIPEFWKK